MLEAKTEKRKNKSKEWDENIVLAKGVDSLYLFCNQGLEFEKLFDYGHETGFDEEITIAGICFIRSRAFMRTYPVSLIFGPFTLYLNRASIYIKVASLGFEMRGFAGCLAWLYSVLDTLADKEQPWEQMLLVSRLDIFTDFIYRWDFNPDRFRTRLRVKGMIESGKEMEGKTLYFGNRATFCVRLYVKSVEIAGTRKAYLSAEWDKQDNYKGEKVWRLEFEFRKKKLDQFCDREINHFDQDLMEMLWGFGIEQIGYLKRSAKRDSKSNDDLHPLWVTLRSILFKEYQILPEKVRKANIRYRWQMAQKAVLSYYAATQTSFEKIPQNIRYAFAIEPDAYSQAKRRVHLIDGLM